METVHCTICDLAFANTIPMDDAIGEFHDGEFYCTACIDEIYDNETGYCSWGCCMGGDCDGSC